MTTQRSSAWSVTINNPTADDEEAMSIARQQGWKVEGQKEVGAEGTPHYQLMVQTPQVRFSAVKRMFPRAHIEIARNVAALATYVTKEETRVGDLPTQQSMYPSLSRYWDLIFQVLAEHHPAEIAVLDSGGYRDTDRHLIMLDDATRLLIRAGYHVESIAVNPQTRTSFAKYAPAIYYRSKISADSQTDRQVTAVAEATLNLAV